MCRALPSPSSGPLTLNALAELCRQTPLYCAVRTWRDRGYPVLRVTSYGTIRSIIAGRLLPRDSAFFLIISVASIYTLYIFPPKYPIHIFTAKRHLLFLSSLHLSSLLFSSPLFTPSLVATMADVQSQIGQPSSSSQSSADLAPILPAGSWDSHVHVVDEVRKHIPTRKGNTKLSVTGTIRFPPRPSLSPKEGQSRRLARL